MTCPDGTFQIHLDRTSRRSACCESFWCPSEALRRRHRRPRGDRLPAHPAATLDLRDPAAGWADVGELRDELLHQERADAQPDRPPARATGGPANRCALLHLALRRREDDHDEQARRAVPAAADHAQLPADREIRPGARHHLGGGLPGQWRQLAAGAGQRDDRRQPRPTSARSKPGRRSSATRSRYGRCATSSTNESAKGGPGVVGPPFVFPFGPGQRALSSSAGVEAADEAVGQSVGTRSVWPA